MPEHNGVAKHLNQTLVEYICTILHASELPKNLWGEVLLYVVWVKNRSATRALDGKTPYKMLYGRKPNLSGLPSWGVKCWILDHSGLKLDDHAKEGHWVGFNAESIVHRIYLPDQHAVVVECNITFQRNDLVSMQIDTTISGTNSDQADPHAKLTNAPGPVINAQPVPAPMPSHPIPNTVVVNLPDGSNL